MYPIRNFSRAMLRALYGPVQGDATSNGHKPDAIAHLSEYDLDAVFGGLSQPIFEEDITRYGIDPTRDL